MSAKSKNSKNCASLGSGKGTGGGMTVHSGKEVGGAKVTTHRIPGVAEMKRFKRADGSTGYLTNATLIAAVKIVDQYQIILAHEDDEWYGHGLEMPNVFADGKTANQCVMKTQDAMIAAVAYMIDAGQIPPAPAKEGQRTEQVNIRLGALEKTTLTAAAKRKGFKSLAGFLRASALDASH